MFGFENELKLWSRRLLPPVNIPTMLWFLIGFAVAIPAVFIFPWNVELGPPVKGESYSMGFSNRFAVIGLWVSIAVVFFGLLIHPPTIKALKWLEDKPNLLPKYREARGEYLVLLVASMLTFAAVLTWNHYLPEPYWGESPYFLSRMDLVGLGFKPYRDFQFLYGPALIYVPVWLDRILFGWPGIENSYAFCVALGFPAGFLCIFFFLRTLNLPCESRPHILALLLLLWFCMTMGLQYTPLRHTLLPALLAVSHCLISRNIRWSCPAVFLSVVTLFLLSPEMGCAGLAGFIAYASVFILSRRIRPGLLVILGLALAGMTLFLFPSGYLNGLRTFATGAYNFPVFPNVSNVMMVLICLFVLPALAVSVFRGLYDSAAPLAAALGVSSVSLLPAAFGRCDPGHIFINGFIPLVLVFPAMAAFGKKYYRLWTIIYVWVFLVLFQISYWGFYFGSYTVAVKQHKFHRDNPAIVSEWKEKWKRLQETTKTQSQLNWRKTVPFPEYGEAISKFGRVAIPLSADVGIERYLKTQKNFATVYFPIPVPDYYIPADTDRVVGESLGFDAILIKKDVMTDLLPNFDSLDCEKQTQVFLAALMLYPVHNKFRNDPFIPEIAVAREFALKTRQIGEFPDYFILKGNSDRSEEKK